MATIYRKTDKGHREIATRALRLAPRFRQLLLLADGRRDDAELRRLVPQAGDTGLQALAEAGLVEPIAITREP